MTAFAEGPEALLARAPRVSAGDWPGELSGLDHPGLYAWWVDARGARDLSRGLRFGLPEGLLYVGQAGASSSVSEAGSAATLRTRIERNHLGGKVRFSTLRCSSAAVLLGPLALTIDGPQQLAPGSEAKLTLWMREHLAIAVWAAPSGDHLAELQREVVQALRPPFNLDHTGPSELRRRLRELRAVVSFGIDDLLVEPDPALGQWRQILGVYGQAFDGYRYAAAVRRSCPDIGQEVERRFQREGRFSGSFAELRCALFWTQRSVHNAEQSPGWEPSRDFENYVLGLYAAIQEVWCRRHGVGLDDAIDAAPSSVG